MFVSSEWWSVLSGAEKIYWTIALVFSVLFFIQFVLSLFGLDFGTETDTDSGSAESGHFGLDPDFTVLSVRSIIAFFTFFGWTGVLLLHKDHSVWTSTFFALVAGSAAMMLVAYLMYVFARLSQSGNPDIYEALFATAEVYIPVPERRKGAGKVHIQLAGSLRELDAVTEGDGIRTGQRVKVVEILDDQVLVVVPLETYEIDSVHIR